MKILFLTLLISLNCFAISVPPLTRPVEDFNQTITDSDKAELEQSIREIWEQGIMQISILLIPSLEGENLEEYSIKVAEKWQLGDKEKDNGLLILMAINDRKIRIEVGQGLEYAVTDYEASKIINDMKPYLRNSNYKEALAEALSTLVKLMKYNSPEAVQERREQAERDKIAREKRIKELEEMFSIGLIAVSSLVTFILVCLGIFQPSQYIKKYKEEISKTNKLKKDKEIEIHSKKEELGKMIVDTEKKNFHDSQQEVSYLRRQESTLRSTVNEMKKYLGV